jgi:hypothetical protein
MTYDTLYKDTPPDLAATGKIPAKITPPVFRIPKNFKAKIQPGPALPGAI